MLAWSQISQVSFASKIRGDKNHNLTFPLKKITFLTGCMKNNGSFEYKGLRSRPIHISFQIRQIGVNKLNTGCQKIRDYRT